MTSARSRRRTAALLLLLAALLPPPAAGQPAPGAAPEPPPAGAAPAPPGAQRAQVIVRADAVQLERDPVRPFFEQHLPEQLLRPGPRGLLWWQWVAFPVLALLAVGLGSLLGWITRRILTQLARRTRTTWDDLLIERIASPLTLLWAVAIVTALHPTLLLDPGATRVLQRVLRAATYLAMFWAGFRSIDVAVTAMGQAAWTRTNPSLAGLLPLGRKIGKVVLLAMGAVAVLNELGFQVASLLAGLGIGGIALALAAQKTVENLFGSVAIGVDQPFRVGDFVKVEEFVATVEAIGMRSTRFRTLDRTTITIPNGRLADMRSETFASRDRIRLLVNLGLSYSTTADQMRTVIAGIKEALRSHPRIFPEGFAVRFNDFRDSTLNVEVSGWLQTADWGEFCDLRSELFLQFMAIVEGAGTSFAFPTRTVHVVAPKGDEVGERRSLG